MVLRDDEGIGTGAFGGAQAPAVAPPPRLSPVRFGNLTLPSRYLLAPLAAQGRASF